MLEKAISTSAGGLWGFTEAFECGNDKIKRVFYDQLVSIMNDELARREARSRVDN